MAHLHLAEGWRLGEDDLCQWISQRENAKARDERHRWKAVSFCGTREGLIEVALPHRAVNPTEAACYLLERLPRHYQPDALGALVVRKAA